MSTSFLKLNSDETELRLIGNPKRLASIENFERILGDSKVRPSASASDLSRVDSMRSETRDGYSSAIKTPVVKSS